MIHEKNEIHWMDIKSENVQNSDISVIFKEYSHMIEQVPCSPDMTIFQINFIDLDDKQIKNIKISDLYGWTNIISIRKIVLTNPFKWYKITAGNREIIVSENTLIPVYYEQSKRRGFHGAVLYNYILKHPSKINPNDRIRIHRGRGSNEFTVAEIEEYESNENFGYEIITKARFGNVNHISVHMFDSITADEATFMTGMNYR